MACEGLLRKQDRQCRPADPHPEQVQVQRQGEANLLLSHDGLRPTRSRISTTARRRMHSAITIR